jgi:hypothetical protein
MSRFTAPANYKWRSPFSDGGESIIAEQQIPAGPDDPLSWMQPVQFAIEPKYAEFFVQEALPDGSSRDHPLFPSCEDYLQSASWLMEEAKSMAERVHTQPVTPPPLYDT